MPTISAAQREVILETWPVARLATRAEASGVFQVPIVFVRHEGRLWSPVDGKPKRGTRLSRLDHVAADPRVSLLLDHYGDDWRRLWWLRLDAHAEEESLGDRDSLRRVLEDKLRGKYPQYSHTPPFLGAPTALAFTPSAQKSWCADPRAISASLSSPPGGQE